MATLYESSCLFCTWEFWIPPHSLGLLLSHVARPEECVTAQLRVIFSHRFLGSESCESDMTFSGREVHQQVLPGLPSNIHSVFLPALISCLLEGRGLSGACWATGVRFSPKPGQSPGIRIYSESNGRFWPIQFSTHKKNHFINRNDSHLHK
jgi:hypothetical protein